MRSYRFILKCLVFEIYIRKCRVRITAYTTDCCLILRFIDRASLYNLVNKTTDSHPHRITSTKCPINIVVSPDDGPIVARNM